ncbi:MAG TPA: cytochrome c [Rhodanobacteraceae bacterium]|nr:cytochrome c [Rhodanobacteraceae bacterium]
MHARTILVSAVAVALTLSFGAASAKGSIAAGKTKAASCEACHGADGQGIAPNYPALAGQYQDYLEQALHEYKDGERTNAIMNGMAASLTDQDIQDITAYFSSLPSKLSNLHDKVQGAGDGLHSR